MKTSILHLSDLHRDALEEPDSDSLIYSLERDFKRFSTLTPEIHLPNICVVSGDLIAGSKKTGDEAYQDIQTQYEQTKNFLVGIANMFFHGDREKIVIVPGNHDVCREDVLKCVEKIKTPNDKREIRELKVLAHSLSSNIRWSWDELCFYKIVDEEIYKQRFSLFSNMYTDFYQGKRSYSLDPSEQWDIFDFKDQGVSIGTINSCFNNDLFRHAGEVNPTALTNMCRAMKDPRRKGWLLAATWHHNTSGPPTREDYISPSFLQILMETDIGLGMHGHQHSPECFEGKNRYGCEKKRITIISASTLCSGSHHLQSGIPRSYNVIEIDEDKRKGRVHQRAMMGEDIKHPTWGSGNFLQTQKSFVDFIPVLPEEARPSNLSLNIAIGDAEKLVSQQQWENAISLLEQYKDHEIARLFLTKALENINDDKKIIDLISPPKTISEAILVGGAINSLRDKELAHNFLSNPIVRDSNDASIRQIKRTIERIIK